MSDLVLKQVEDRVALITVNDPDRRNAVTTEISAALRAAIDTAEDDPGVHAIIVTGAGRAFCAGADLTALGAAAEDGLRVIYTGSSRSRTVHCRRSPRSTGQPSVRV